MVGMQCNGAAFLTSFQEGPHQKLFFQNSASTMANCIIVDTSIVNYLMLLLANALRLFLNFLFPFTKI